VRTSARGSWTHELKSLLVKLDAGVEGEGNAGEDEYVHDLVAGAEVVESSSLAQTLRQSVHVEEHP